MTLAIDAEKVVKRFPVTSGYRDILAFWKRNTVQVLNGVTLNVPAGESTALLGPNGAGKTTLLKILAGLVIADEGYIEVDGVDVTDGSSATRGRLTYVSNEERSLFWRLTGRQNLRVFATLQHISGAEQGRLIPDLLDLVGLSGSADRMVMRYSSGMRQRLAIARGLLSRPRIMLLDEPTRSLDPVGARQMWDFIRSELVNKFGTTLLLATHNMEEAGYLCDKVAVLHQGSLRAHDTVSTVTSRLSGQERWVIRTTCRLNGNAASLMTLPGIHRVQEIIMNGTRQGSSLELELDNAQNSIPLVVRRLVDSGVGIEGVEKVQVSLGSAIEQLTKAES
jgi:ABC-2 type transport system ATP-binding protein